MSVTTKNCHLLISLILILKSSQADCQNSCPDVPKIPDLPGMGWDALTNEDTKQIMELSYNECKLTNDGKYLIPDNTVAVSLPVEEKHIVGEIFDHWTNYTAPAASSFKTSTGNVTILPLYYSFSDEYQEIKKLQVKHQARVCRTQLRQLFYRIHLKSDSVMTESAKSRFIEVIRAINTNRTEAAGRIVENIIKDYGTHYSNSADVGTILLREDYLNDNFYRVNENRRGSVMSASKLSLLDYTGFTWRDRQYLDTSLLDDYNDAILEKKIRFYGGPNWERGVKAGNMVAIDRSGHLLSNLITTVNFPKVTSTMITKVKEIINEVIREYFNRNVHKGCILPKSKDFDFSTNLDDGSCSLQVSDYVFGGVYEKCQSFSATYAASTVCSGNVIKNPLTKSVSCPSDLYSTIIDERYKLYEHANDFKVSLVSCIGSNSSAGLSFMFGGLFSSDVVNNHTKSKSCPSSYKEFPVLDKKVTICINTTNDKVAQRYALPFGGLVSWSTEFQCPIGYDRHLAVNNNDKNIYYCLRGPNMTNFGVVPTLVRPPFDVKCCECPSDTI